MTSEPTVTSCETIFLSRRRLLRRGMAAVGAALATAALAACGGGSSSTATPASAATKAPSATASSSPTTAAGTTARSIPGATAGSFSFATPTAGASAVTAAGGVFDWQKYAGTKIRVLVPTFPQTLAVKKLLPDFEKLTGIKVEYEDLVETSSRQKLTVEFTAGASTIDVFVSTVYQEKRLFAKNGWYAYLDGFLNDPKFTAPDYDFNDFFQGSKDAMLISGKTLGIPFSLSSLLTFYRKDLFDKAGMKPPTNVEELEAAAKKLHNPPAVYGFVTRGQKTQNIATVDGFLRNFGGGYLDKSGTPILNSDADVKAVDYYAMMLRKYGPPGVTNFSWPEAGALFQQGRVALWTDGDSFGSLLEDKEKSTVVGKAGYAPFPAGPAGNSPPIFSNSLSIYANSRNKEAAWYFVQWATGKKVLLEVLKVGAAVGRGSAWASPEVKSTGTLSPDFYDTDLAMLKIGAPAFPDVIHVAESRDIISSGVIDVINGQDVKMVMDRVQQEFKTLVDQEKS